MNILYINHYAGSLEHGMEYRPYYLAREWVRSGHQVRIVAASHSHVRIHQPELAGSLRTSELLDGIEYVWVATPRYHGNGVQRVLNIVAFVWRLWWLARDLVLEQAPDVVIASSTHPLDIYPAHRIAQMAGARLVFEVHDLWPLTPIEIGGMSSLHPFIVLLQHAEDYAYRVASTVVSMLPNAKGHMVSRGMDPGKFVHIPNGIDFAEWANERQPLEPTHQIVLDGMKQRGMFILGYAGAHGASNALSTLVEAAVVLREAPVCFVLVGQGPERESLIRRAREQGLSNVTFLVPIAKQSIPALLEQCDALYIGLKSQPVFRFGISPNKLMDYMMAGRPIIQAIAAGNDPVGEAKCGIAIPPEQPEAVAEAVRRLLAMSSRERDAMGERGQTHVRAHHDYRGLADRWVQVCTGNTLNG